jgi:hypothetical protein
VVLGVAAEPPYAPPVTPLDRPAVRRHLPAIWLAVTVPALSLLTVLRHTRYNLQADGIEQSVMSVQDIDLFYWGQDRLAPVVSWVASPIADPSLNLWACLFLQAVVFHSFFLVLARLCTRAVSGTDSWWSTTILFLVLTGVTHLTLNSAAIWALALEGQPYALSHLMVLSAFMLWRRHTPAASMAAAGLVWLTCGVNTAAILVLAALALVSAIRGGRWLWWSSLGGISLISVASWTYLADRFGGQASMAAESHDYYAFHLRSYATALPAAFDSLLSTLRFPWGPAILFVAVVCSLSLSDERRRVLRPRFALVGAFALVYVGLFATNEWVRMNQYHFRYFAPAIFIGLLAMAVPITAFLMESWPRLSTRLSALGMPAAVTALSVVTLVPIAGLYGALDDPNRSVAVTAVRPTADYARDHDVRFISGYYWDMWPLLHVALDDGRHAAFVTAEKSGGNKADYERAFQQELDGEGPPRALCVNSPVETCAAFLTLWTAEGWVETPERCPAPRRLPLLGGAANPLRQCVVMEYTGV